MVAAVLAAGLALGGAATFAIPTLSAYVPGLGGAPQAAVAPTPVADLRIDRVSPSPETYGIGIVVRVYFNRDVPESLRTAVTDRIAVTSSKPIGESGWAWADPRTAIFRPKDFWPANSTVTVSALPTLEIVGQASGSDLRWAGEADRTFSIGAAQVIRVNGKTDQATVVRNGTTIRTMPISLGKPGWQTRSGVKVLMEKYQVKTMTSESIGAEEEYALEVPYAIRLTNSGEFIHAAPWAAARLGRTNGSHGCTNVSMSDAIWLYEHHLYGDPVITTGTTRYMEPGNGAGGVWNVPWHTWLTGHAA